MTRLALPHPMKGRVPLRRAILAGVAAAGAVLSCTGAGAQTTTTPPATTTPTTTPAPAAPTPAAPTPAVAHWYDRINVSGSLETYYDYNTNSPAGRLNQLQNWNFHANQFGLPLAELAFQETPDPVNSPLGFKLVLAYGEAADWIAGSSAAEQSYKNIKEANASYIFSGKSAAPVTVTLGKFVTCCGEEVIESQNNFNYSHSLLFTWAIPYYHFGVSASRPFGPKVTATAYLVNGWNNIVDNNNAKTVGYSLVYNPNPKLSFTTNGFDGAQNGGERQWAFLTDNILSYTPSNKWTFVGNYDYGHDWAGAGGTSVHWQGIAGYAHYVIDSKSAGTVRAEVFGDPNGFMIAAPPFAPVGLVGVSPAFARTPAVTSTVGTVLPVGGGVPQEVKEVTLTYEHKFHPRITTRWEVREDWSTADVFSKGTAGLSKTQTQLIFGNIFTF